MHVPTCTHRHTGSCLSSPLPQPEWDGAGQGRVGTAPGQSPIAQCQDRTGSQRSGTRLSAPAGPCNQASVGPGLLILLEKLGLCQFLCFRFFLGWWAPAPLRPVGCSGGSESASSPPTWGCLAGRGDQATQHCPPPPSRKLRPGALGGTAFSLYPLPSASCFLVLSPLLFFLLLLCERSGSNQQVNQGAHSSHPSVSKRVPPSLGTRRPQWMDSSEASWGSYPLVVCSDRCGQKS